VRGEPGHLVEADGVEHERQVEADDAARGDGDEDGEVCGVEWSGVEWSGVEWCGVVWSELEWCGVECRLALKECKEVLERTEELSVRV
jgi:hypothetical protein